MSGNVRRVSQVAMWLGAACLGLLPPLSAQEPKLRSTLQEHTSVVLCVAFSPDGKTLASGSNDNNTIKLWAVVTGKERATLTGHMNGVHAVAFSPDGKTLASAGGDQTIKLWDVARGK